MNRFDKHQIIPRTFSMDILQNTYGTRVSKLVIFSKISALLLLITNNYGWK